MYIYKITNTVNGKQYVGQTQYSIQKRWCGHKNSSSSALAVDLQLFGPDVFVVEQLQECSTLKELNEAEKYWIRTLKTMAPNGYNLRPGGCQGTIKRRAKPLPNRRLEKVKDQEEAVRLLEEIQHLELCSKVLDEQDNVVGVAWKRYFIPLDYINPRVVL